MLTRRCFSATLIAGLSTPMITRGQPANAIAATAAGLGQLHAILIRHGDDIVLEQAPRGAGLDRPANIKSCSKSLLALLLGTAVTRGEIALTSRLGEIAPRLIPADVTEGAADTTMADLVTLRMGLEGTSGANYGAWAASRNWISYVLQQPRRAPAGSRMIYSTGTTHVLGAALSVATGETLLALARARIGAPLGIEIAPWARDPQGYYLGGNEMALTPRAMLTVATMIRDGGRHDGRQVIAEAWLRDSSQPRTRSPYSGLSYGYGWFMSETGWILARGFGGQIIAAHPGRALAVAITSDPHQPARSEGYFGALMALLNGPVLALG